jgi:hypothetical protein
MATNQIYAMNWLVQRLEWERTLADLHLRAGLDVESEGAAMPLGVPSGVTAGTDEGEPSRVMTERNTRSWCKRALGPRRSPVRL